jgi:anti-sigma regulatory factor (Ser/Thr protein kinase)
MVKLRKRGEEIREFILANVQEHPHDIATLTAQQFGISRQAVNKHIRLLVNQKALAVKGATKDRQYELHPLVEWGKPYTLKDNLQEDVVWSQDIKPLLNDLPDNVKDIWAYAFTEMFNNAIEHSSGKYVHVHVERTAVATKIWILDDGEGIFRKIQRELNLEDERHAVLELSKGKLTTDPSRHSGEGIFFTSRVVDEFYILSGNVSFNHKHRDPTDWIWQAEKERTGTNVLMELSNHTSRTSHQVFKEFTTDEDFGFTKTVVPVRLAQYGDETLVSRSQAKRLLARVDRFKIVIFDFEGVEAIGQAFADEVFRVFNRQHPEMELMAINANQNVQQMIRRAETHE